jgi:hypothetical protein
LNDEKKKLEKSREHLPLVREVDIAQDDGNG